MFKYMEDYYLEPKQSYSSKYTKVVEEFGELKECVENYGPVSSTAEEIAQESLDLILSTTNFLRKMQDEGLIDIGTETFKHSVKLNQYLETGKYTK
ncbi:hypothetical protein [uncultured Clostridium sp.]|uniref:hypothetical protein n=1 Tax=uncultured Clostridium sp. TaxID=59620 RepID=UPI00261F1CE0|nr:hypothetical protein [uncultured Clostridium sp.]